MVLWLWLVCGDAAIVSASSSFVLSHLMVHSLLNSSMSSLYSCCAFSYQFIVFPLFVFVLCL